MQLKKYQIATLIFYSDCKESELTFTGWLKRCWQCYLMGIIFVAILIVSDMVIGVSTSSLVYYGLFGGLFARDIATYYRLRQNWPVLKRIIDWDKLQALLNDEEYERQHGKK